MRTAGSRIQVTKWGNSQGVRLPKAVLEQAQVKEGDELIVRVEDGRIALEPAQTIPTLTQLVSRITPKNRHKAEDWGKPQGNEVW
ncbi:MAG TPA: AbrB/MazE/SpoVT family DNA-binding domain-containing protein [Terriglobales bacterium]|nr:AbrB/MazE/SpoVT family DNA-binding domain-containing protein [Terriglobales bacterium]